MRTQLSALKILAACSLVMMLSDCKKSSSEDNSDPGAQTQEDKEIINTFVESVVLPTYRDLATDSAALDTAVTSLVEEPSEVHWQAARAAWTATRAPWEQSEAFLFGPVDSYGYDPALDSWPLDHSGLTVAINTYAKDASLNLDTVDPNLKGFHAIEFILFGYEKSKTLASLSNDEKIYLRALTKNHSAVTGRLLAAWNDGTNGKTAFALVLKSAGNDDNRAYPTTQSAIQEMLEGMVGIADEVANNKIAQPFNQADPNLVESQFSFNSLEDFQNNIRSIRFVYQGSRDGQAAIDSLSHRVSLIDPSLDKQVEDAISASITALQAIPDPFRDAIVDPTAKPKIEAAQIAIRSLQGLLDKNVRAVLIR